MTSDDELYATYRAGETASFDVLYDRHTPRLLGFVAALGAPISDAEDVVQETWIKMIRRNAPYTATGRFRPWLFRIAHRVWLDRVRSAWKRKVDTEAAFAEEHATPIDKAFAAGASPAEAADLRERTERLYGALEQLPDALRQTLLLRIDGGMTFREIGEAMGCPLGTALWRAQEAQRRLKSILGVQV